MNFSIDFEIPKYALKVVFFGLFLVFSIDFALHFRIFFESVTLRLKGRSYYAWRTNGECVHRVPTFDLTGSIFIRFASKLKEARINGVRRCDNFCSYFGIDLLRVSLDIKNCLILKWILADCAWNIIVSSSWSVLFRFSGYGFSRGIYTCRHWAEWWNDRTGTRQ